MQTTHSSLDFRRANVSDPLSFPMLDENAGEKTNEICRMEKDIIFIKRHTVVDSRCKMVSPHSVLSTHMFLLCTILLFTALEQRLCCTSAIEVKQEDRKGETNWL